MPLHWYFDNSGNTIDPALLFTCFRAVTAEKYLFLVDISCCIYFLPCGDGLPLDYNYSPVNFTTDRAAIY